MSQRLLFGYLHQELLYFPLSRVYQPQVDADVLIPVGCNPNNPYSVLFHLHRYPCTRVLMELSAKLFFFIMLMGFRQFFIFQIGEAWKIFCYYCTVHCSQMEMLSLLFTDAAKISADGMYICSIHVHRQFILYSIIHVQGVLLSILLILKNVACVSVHLSACANLCQCVWFFFFLGWGGWVFLYFGLCAMCILNSLSLPSLIAMV